MPLPEKNRGGIMSRPFSVTYPLAFRFLGLVATLFFAAALQGSLYAQLSGGTHSVQYSGTIFEGSAITPEAPAGAGTVNVTFSLYRDQTGGAPLWQEGQTVKIDASGRYTVLLGAASTGGLPAGLFSKREARWLGVRAQGKAEQPRVLLVSGAPPAEQRQREQHHDQQLNQDLNQQLNQQHDQQIDQPQGEPLNQPLDQSR
jgi:hypothetical protein